MVLSKPSIVIGLAEYLEILINKCLQLIFGYERLNGAKGQPVQIKLCLYVLAIDFIVFKKLLSRLSSDIIF